MWEILKIALLTSLLVTWSECRPSERSEINRGISPFDISADIKEAIVYNVIQRRIIDAHHPKPIVDTITEEEKYGNTMEHPIGQKVVKGVEGVTKLVNSAVSVSKGAAWQGVSKVVALLDMVGGKLVGLQ